MVVSSTRRHLCGVPDADPLPAYLRAFGLTVRRLRKRSGFSQESFAHEAGLDRTYVSGIERGVRNPTVATLLRIAGALGTTPGALLRGADKAAK